MLAVRLFCNAGLSARLLASKMREAAEERGLDANIEVRPVGEIGREAKGASCALLAPQAGHQLAEAKETCAALGVPLGVIPAVDYGTVNAPRVLDLALTLAGM